MQKSKCWDQPIALNQKQEPAIWKIDEKVEWNERQKIIDKFCMKVSQTDLSYIFDFCICSLVLVFQNEFEQAINQKHGLNQILKQIILIQILLGKHSSINLLRYVYPLHCCLIDAIIWCWICSYFIILFFRKAEIVNVVSERSKICICKR